MNNGIKPTRLWYLTGKKHFASIIKDKHDALPRPLTTRLMEDSVQLIALLYASAAALCFTYGKFCPGRDYNKLKKLSKDPCAPPTKTPYNKDNIPGPCPRDKGGDKPQKCPKTDI